mgnify:CR=1 FL=1
MADGVHPYNFSTTRHNNDFERLGHPGKFYKVVECTSGTTFFTGSNYGAGGILVPTGSNGTVFLSNGGSIPASALVGSSTSIHELSVSAVTVSAGTIYVLIRNQLVR